MDMEFELTLEPVLEETAALVAAEEPPKPQISELVLSD